MRQPDDECMACGCDGRPEVEVIARTMDGELVIDRATLCTDCAEKDLGGALLSDCVREFCEYARSPENQEQRSPEDSPEV